MKLYFLLILNFVCISLHAQYSQTRAASNVTVNYKVSDWINYSASAFANNDNLYASTKVTSGGHPVFFDHFGFNIPSDATITGIACTIRKYKTGKGEVKDVDGLTWFLTRATCSFTPDCNMSYGPAMHDLNPWNTKETTVTYQTAGSGSYTTTTTTSAGTRTVVTVNYQWTPQMINDIMFGFTFNPGISIKGGGAAIYIDQLEVTVHYTLPATPRGKIVRNQPSNIFFNAIVLNNPTKSHFVVKTEGSEKEILTLRITDSYGRLIDERQSAGSNRQFIIGNNYAPGLYFAEIVQGSERKVLKLVKN